jgi:hypothetical protein
MKKDTFKQCKEDVLEMIKECVSPEELEQVSQMSNLYEMGQYLLKNYFWEEEDFERHLEEYEFR